MMMEWQMRRPEGRTVYTGRGAAPDGAEFVAKVYRGEGREWIAEYAGIRSGAHHSAAGAREWVETVLESRHKRAAAEKEAATNYAAVRRLANESGRAYFAEVQAGLRRAPDNLDSLAHWEFVGTYGVFAPSAKRAAFCVAFRAGYRDAEFLAEQAAKPAEIIRPEFEEKEESGEDRARRMGKAAGIRDFRPAHSPREGRIEHLSYLDGFDTPREKAAYRAGYLSAFPFPIVR